jgi:hypothetical protein
MNPLRIKKLASLALAALFSLSQSTSFAMGSGNKFADAQIGVTYSVYEPKNLLGLPALAFQMRPCREYPGHDEFLFASYGGAELGIALVETSAEFNCTGLDKPHSLGTIMINGVKAKVGIYCIANTCPANKFSHYGGEISFIAPGTKYVKPTFIRIGTQGGFTLKQLIAFATGLKRIGTK